MSDLEQRQADRLRVMRAIYDLTGDNTAQYVRLWDVRDVLGFDDDRMANAVDFLEDSGMISALRTMAGQRTPIQARIQHAGVVEIERAGRAAPGVEQQRTPPQATITPSGVREILEALRRPDTPTEHFPPANSVNVFNIGGSVYGSPFQVASPGASQVVETRVETVAVGDMNRVRVFLTEYSAGHRVLTFSREMEPDAFTEFSCEVETLVAQLRSPRPKAATIRLSLSTIRRLIVQVPGEDTLALLRRLDQIDI
jgi:hypothetical protein